MLKIKASKRYNPIFKKCLIVNWREKKIDRNNIKDKQIQINIKRQIIWIFKAKNKGTLTSQLTAFQ